MGPRVQLETTIIKSNLGKYLFAVCAENNAVYHIHVLLYKRIPTLSCRCYCAVQKKADSKVDYLIIYILYVILWLYLN
jgi:hypothetical protein